VKSATTHYAKGVAVAATGNVSAFQFGAALKSVPMTRIDYPNRCVDTLPVGLAILLDEIEYRRGNYTIAFDSLRLAIELEHNLVYSQPWGSMQPVCSCIYDVITRTGAR
jgi:hypothetical protein